MKEWQVVLMAVVATLGFYEFGFGKKSKGWTGLDFASSLSLQVLLIGMVASALDKFQNIGLVALWPYAFLAWFIIEFIRHEKKWFPNHHPSNQGPRQRRP